MTKRSERPETRNAITVDLTDREAWALLDYDVARICTLSWRKRIGDVMSSFMRRIALMCCGKGHG
jgi:hypothetical protein